MATDKIKYSISLTGKYAKETLVKLETLFNVERLDPNVRKIVLDGYNELAREQEKILTDK